MIKIYTDGSSKGNPGLGGYSALYIIDKKLYIIADKAEKNVTNNRMELKAILAALKYAENHLEEFFLICSDSAYCVNICNSWIKNWATNDWKLTNKNKEVENLDLVKEIYKILDKEVLNFDIQKVAGHSGEVGNEFADALASNNSEKLKSLLNKYKLEIV